MMCGEESTPIIHVNQYIYTIERPPEDCVEFVFKSLLNVCAICW